MAAFVRLSVLGVTVIMPFLAAASSSVPLSLAGRPIVALLVVGVAFHVFAYVSNDVIDLPIDRTAPARASSPLVRGTVRPAQGAAVAAAQVPIGVAATWWGGGHARGVGALLVACALMLAYNLWGKRSPWPLLTDVVQGLSWAAFAAVGVFVAGGPGPATGWLLAFITVYIVLTNGVHGSIRDIRNDLHHRVRSTAIRLGARPGPGRSLGIPPSVVRYAFGLQAVLTVLALAPAIGSGPILVVVLLVAAASFALLRVTLRCACDEKLLWSAGTLHLIVTWLLPVVFLLRTSPGWLGTLLLAFFAVPFLASGMLREALRWGWWRHPDMVAASSWSARKLRRPSSWSARKLRRPSSWPARKLRRLSGGDDPD